MKQNNESPINRITQEFADSGTLFYLEAKYLSLVTKAIHDSNYSKALPDRMGCRGKAGKIATELVCRFLNKYGLVLTYNSFNSEYSQKLSNRDNGQMLIDIAKLKDEANPLHELVQVMKNTERHQYHHPKLVQALMNKVPHLLNDETKSHFNSILSRATVAKNNRQQNSKELQNLQGSNRTDPTITDRSTSLNSPAVTSPNQITTTIQQPIVFLDEGTDDDSPGKSKGKQRNLLLTLNLNIKSPTNPDEQAVLELSPPLPNPSQVTATAVLLPDGDDYHKISSSNGTNQIYNEEEENIREQFSPSYQNRDIQSPQNTPNQSQNAQNFNNIPNQPDKEYEYEYEYEVEENQIPNTESNENTPKKNNKKEKKEKPKKSPKTKKSNKKPKKKNSIDPQIQQQLNQQQLIIQKLQELNLFQQQQQQEQQQKFQQQLQQQELQQQQLQQLLQEQQLQQEQIQQQLKQEQQKAYRQSPTSNTSQTGYSSVEESEEKNENSDSSYNDNTAFSEENRMDQQRANSEESMTSVADFIDDQTDVKKRGIQSISNALDNLLKNKKKVIDDDDESSVVIPIERKVKPQLQIEAFSMPEVPFNDNSQYYSDLTDNNDEVNSNSEYSSYSNYSNTNNAQDANSEYSNYSNINEKAPSIEDLELGNPQERDLNIENPNDENNDNNYNNIEENFEPASSQATSTAAKEYPDEVIRSIKQAFSPQKEKEDSFATTKDSYIKEEEELPDAAKYSYTATKEEDSQDTAKYSYTATKEEDSQDVTNYSYTATKDYSPEPTKADYYYSTYYSSEYYSEDEDDKRQKDDKKQVKFKLRINREQFERFYPNQNLSNSQTIKVSKRGLNQLQEIMSKRKNSNEPLRQVIRLKTPTLQSPLPFQSPTPFNQPPPPPQQQQQQPQQQPRSPERQKPNDQSTISVVTKGPHTGLIKRKIKKSDHQADIQKKLKEKTEYAKKLQEELERRMKEMEQQAAANNNIINNLQMTNNNNNNNIQMTNNKKLARSQPQTRTKRSASPKDIDRPSSAPKKKGRNANNYRKRDIQLYNDFEPINTSSLLPSELSTVSEVHPELMSPKQREQKKKEIRRKIKKLNDELQQRNDPEEKRRKREKIKAKIQQLKEEFERSSTNDEREIKKRKINSQMKKLNNLDQSPNFTNSPRNNNFNNMTPAQRRKRRNEIKLELKKLHAEYEINSNAEQEQNNQLGSSDINEDFRPVIPGRNNNNYQMNLDQIPVPQPRPRQPQQIERNININNAINNPSISDKNDQSGYYTSYNSNSNIETEESYNSQSPIQNQPKQIQIQHDDDNDDINHEIINNDYEKNESSNFININGSSSNSSLLERRKHKNLKVDIPAKDGKEAAFKKYNEQENRRKEDDRISEMDDEDVNSNNYDEDDDKESVSVNSGIMKQPEYKPRKINIKKDSTPERRKNSQIDDEDDKNKPKIIDETIVIKDGKKKIRRRIHIPIPQNQNNLNENLNDYDGSKKVISKSSSKHNNDQKASLNDFSSEVKMDGGLGQSKQEREVDVVTNPEYSNNDQDIISNFLLHVNVIEAKGVPRIDSFDPCDPYCLIFVEGQNDDSSRRTKSMEKTSNPVWNENFELIINDEKEKHHRRRKNNSLNQSCILNVQIKDEDLTAGDVLLSSTKIDLNKFQIGKSYDMWFQLQNEANSEENIQKNSTKSTSNTNSSKGTGSTSSRGGGRIHLILEKTALLDEGENDNEEDNPNKSISYSASNSYKNINGMQLFDNQNGQNIKLNLLIDQAEGLSKRNQYIVAKIKNSPEGLMKTMPINSSEPTWNQSFKLKLPNPQNDVLLITLRTKDEKNGDDDIGNISIPISTLTPPNSGQIVDKWYEFRSTSYSSKTKNHRGGHLSSQNICGKLHLLLSTELDKEDTNSNSYSNSVTPNASSNNSALPVSSSLQQMNGNPLIVKQAPNSSARHLAVQIIEARGLPSSCSPYCIIQIRDEKPILHTRAVRPSLPPKWNQKVEFHSRKAIEDGILDISIKDKRSNKESEIASLSLSVESLNRAKRDATRNDLDEDDQNFVINKWFPLEPSGEIHLIIAPRMKDSPKPTILTPIDNKQPEDQYENVKSIDDLPGVQIDASSSDIDIDVDFDVRKEKEKITRKKARRNKKLSLQGRESAESDIENRKKRILEQFPPTTSEEE